MKFSNQINYHTIELHHLERGMVGCIFLHADLYDELEAVEIGGMVRRVHDAWWRRREFEHLHIDSYPVNFQ